MKDVILLGAGPAACFMAMSLTRLGLSPMMIGRKRKTHCVEGVSQRVVDALEQLGFRQALSLLGPRWGRVSCWNGQQVAMNGEFVVDRVAFDQGLLDEVLASGIEFRDGRVLDLGRDSDGAWRIGWEDSSGSVRHTQARLVVECRGHAAPKTGPDIAAGRTLIALARTFEGALAQARTTVIESFESGWAWGGVDSQGGSHIQAVVLPETIAFHGGDLAAAHAACLKQLTHLPERFGKGIRPVGVTRVRAIRPVLRSDLAGRMFLRVGDAAYTCDPLSGHGVFEAVSGAFAAAPVVNTLLRRPEMTALALDYMCGRAESLFLSRLNAARDHYAGETFWPESLFWKRMSASPSADQLRHSRTDRSARFEFRPVVEDGFIAERRVAVSKNYPRGVRFIDGVELSEIDRLLNTEGVCRSAELSSRLGLRQDAVVRALNWLRSQNIQLPPDVDPAIPTTALGVTEDEHQIS